MIRKQADKVKEEGDYTKRMTIKKPKDSLKKNNTGTLNKSKSFICKLNTKFLLRPSQPYFSYGIKCSVKVELKLLR